MKDILQKKTYRQEATIKRVGMRYAYPNDHEFMPVKYLFRNKKWEIYFLYDSLNVVKRQTGAYPEFLYMIDEDNEGSITVEFIATLGERGLINSHWNMESLTIFPKHIQRKIMNFWKMRRMLL
jgi:hypothetical protein